MSTTTEQQPESGPPPSPEPDAPASSRWGDALRAVATSSATTVLLAFFLAVLVGSVLVAVTDETVRSSAGYLTARPGDFFSASWDAIWGAYEALF